MHTIIGLFDHYGYIVLLIGLMLELIAFPLPGEVLMTYCGVLINANKMNWALSIFTAAFGAALGITLSYFIGRFLGIAFFKKYGHYVHMDKNRLDKISEWFGRYGNKLLIIAYFIPGLRHITGYFSGITNISYKKFAIYAYLGAFIWTGTFISIGKVLGGNWQKYHALITKYLLIGSLITALIIMTVYFYRYHRKQIFEFVGESLKSSYRVFNSFGKIRMAIAGIAAVLFIFISLLIGIVQDYLAHEFSQFDEVVSFLVSQIFNKQWTDTMLLFKGLSSNYVIFLAATAALIYILIKGVNKINEIKFLFSSYAGAEILGRLLRGIIFHRVGPSGAILYEYGRYTFPSTEALTNFVVFGFLAYIVVRHARKVWFSTAIILLSFAVTVLSDLSILYLKLEYPSDIMAGYIFGGVWLSLNIILMEIYRVLPDINFKVNE